MEKLLTEWSPPRDTKKNTSFMYGQVTGVEVIHQPPKTWRMHDRQGVMDANSPMGRRPEGLSVWATVQNADHYVRAWLGKKEMVDVTDGAIAEYAAGFDEFMGALVRVDTYFSERSGLFSKPRERFSSFEDLLDDLVKKNNPRFKQRAYIAQISPSLHERFEQKGDLILLV